jgi:lysophospholipase L1-like esterase
MTAKAVFENMKKKKNPTIKLLGDSITHGVGGVGFKQDGEPIAAEFKRNPNGYCWAKSFSEVMSERYGATVINNACTGTTIEFVIENFDTLVDPCDDLVICTIGTNNRHQYKKTGEKRSRVEMTDTFYSNILALDAKFRAISVPVIFIANIPATEANEKDGADYWRILHMKDIADLYKLASVECSFALISLYDAMNEYLRRVGKQLEEFLPDGLHPNNAGYDVMLTLILDALGEARI